MQSADYKLSVVSFQISVDDGTFFVISAVRSYMNIPALYRRLSRYIVIMLLCCITISGCSFDEPKEGPGPEVEPQVSENQPAFPAQPPEQNKPDNTDISESIVEITTGEFRAVWVATVSNLDFPTQQNLSITAMKREIDAIVDYTADLGLNAIIFQVRPAGDSFYQSDIFPWSQWLTGTQGRGIPDFDPLAYWIEACHAKGLELHAWLNPYRIIHTISNSSDPDTLAPDNPVRLRPELAVGWRDSGGNKGLFLDPGLPEARELVIAGVAEIVANYDVDGIHIDDYFYPGTDFNDEASFNKYGGGMELADWRRENVNLLIKGIGDTIHKINEELGKNVRWGVSPTAIWMNGSSDPSGVPTTSGQESYKAMYADTRRWVMEEWVEYICPQIYWYIGFDIADFESVFDWWVQLCADYNVDLYIGHAAYREAQNDQPPHWSGEMTRQLEMAASSDIVKGSVFYRFQFLKGDVGDSIRDFYSIKDGVPTHPPSIDIDTLSVGTPLQDTAVTAASGAAVGYRIMGTSDPGKPLYINGAEVTGRSVEGFFSVFVLLDSGDNTYTFTQEGQDDVTRTITRSAPTSTTTPTDAATISPVTDTVYAKVITDTAWVFPANSASGGSDWLLTRDQTDRVIATSSNGYVKLSCGMWISRSDVSLTPEGDSIENVLTGGVYHSGMDYDMITWRSDVFAAVCSGYDGKVLTVKFGLHTQAPPLVLPDDLSETIFENIQSGKAGDAPFYAFTIRDDVKYEGCYTEYVDGEFRLYLKKRKTTAEGDKPLTGITIVLDPGHGGEEYGAVGPMGRFLPEKELNLINSRALAELLIDLGATVYITRYSDVDKTLQERVDYSLRINPDLFISLHVNSIAETTDATNIHGLTVWYRNPGSVEFAEILLDNMYYVNPMTNRNRIINQANYFVCRPQWSPTVLIEASFIVNVSDFVWLIDPTQQDKMANAAVDAILEYFSVE